jgi:hypothetical protein
LLPILALSALCALNSSVLASEESSTPEKRGFFSRMLHPFQKNPPPPEHPGEARGSWRRLTLTMLMEPLPLKLPDTRQMKVTLTLTNHSSRFVQLEFPTTQRIEVVVKNLNGKLVEQWSEDHAFTNEPGMVSINPNEHLTYTVTVSTRDMKPGETYSVEGFFPNYEGLAVKKSVTPTK